MTAGAIPADVPAEDAEMWCERCGQHHGVVWFGPSDLWNAVMRGGVRANPDEFGFCCPLCFMQLADQRLGPGIFEVKRESTKSLASKPLAEKEGFEPSSQAFRLRHWDGIHPEGGLHE